MDEAPATTSSVGSGVMAGGKYGLILGRGVSHAVSMDGALKLEEVVYVPGMSYRAAWVRSGRTPWRGGAKAEFSRLVA